MFPGSLQTPDLCVTDTDMRPQEPQCCFTATTAIVSCQPPVPHLNGTYYQCLYQAETQPKNDVGKETSAIGVNYSGRKSIPRWLLTRGKIIKTKGMEGSADQRGAQGAVWILLPSQITPTLTRRLKQSPPHPGMPWGCPTAVTSPQISVSCLQCKHLPLRANYSDAEEKKKNKNHYGLLFELFRA